MTPGDHPAARATAPSSCSAPPATALISADQLEATTQDPRLHALPNAADGACPAEHRAARSWPSTASWRTLDVTSPTCATTGRRTASCSTPMTSPTASSSSTTSATRPCTTRSPAWPTARCSRELVERARPQGNGVGRACCSSTSTTSRPSTTASATPSATSCSSAVAERLAASLPADATAPASAATSSPCWSSASGDELGPVGVALRLLNELRRPFEHQRPGDRGHRQHRHRRHRRRAATTAEVVLRNADMAMYLAKEQGKGRVELFEEAMHATAFERLELKADLARGIEAGPAAPRLPAHRVARDRAHHRRRGAGALAPPAAGPAVARRASSRSPRRPGSSCRSAGGCSRRPASSCAAWQLSLPAAPPLSMSVNLSVRQLEQRDHRRRRAATWSTGRPRPVDPHPRDHRDDGHRPTPTRQRRLAALQGARRAARARRLRHRLLVARLPASDLPVDMLKIDRSFVDGLGDGEATPVVEAIIELAQRARRAHGGRGHRAPSSSTALQQLGCDLGQGYCFSGPVEADQLGDLLAASLIDGGSSPLPARRKRPRLTVVGDRSGTWGVAQAGPRVREALTGTRG